VAAHLAGGQLVGGGLAAQYVIDTAAPILGITQAKLRSALSSGKSLGRVASEHGTSLSALTRTVLARLTSEVGQILH
jgi:hypothetical protein